ncbi:MAG: prmC [Anaerosolibacter sp.]|jgi:release factor glutamine methyltransferase|uniref:peptide chain release factor N(5)-glutamine methyltransferase n=1 Tax=Anaerosolibacter sp. TaxID=1872527 RepID=UPI00261F39BB|nr:peptide chain release factor N(5)-glutamine methyltransferase [Anaerosolibacter sp.]MDF2545637.1 prmC [Anaerosolibacter sp.]
MVRIQDALREAVERLEAINIMTPLLDAEVLLCHVLDMDRLFLYVHRDRELTEDQLKTYSSMVAKRLEGVPVQYIVNKQEFMSLDFYVEEGVLIPRPDTEILVESVLAWAKEQGDQHNLIIADLGTGSGAITVSLAYYLRESFVYSVDISPKALSIGRKNAKILGVEERIGFVHGDLFEPLREKGLENCLDILVSNPPYIPKKEIDKLQTEVAKYEPKLALDGGEDGLDFYRRIIDEAYVFLKNGGLIALEVGHDQGETIKKMMEHKNIYADIRKIKDLSDIERVVVATVRK